MHLPQLAFHLNALHCAYDCLRLYIQHSERQILELRPHGEYHFLFLKRKWTISRINVSSAYLDEVALYHFECLDCRLK